MEELNKIEVNELIGLMDCVISDCMIDKDWNDLSVLLTTLLIVLARYNFTSEDLYNAYIEKNKVNHQRQDNNY